MRHILSPLAEILAGKQTAILVTIIEQRGSSPGSSGARMLVDSKGNSYGSIGGGIVEKNCQTAAAKLYEEEAESRILQFTLNNETAAENGMICGGTVTVLLQKTAPHLLSLITLLQQEYNKRKRPLLLTRLPKENEEPEMTVITGSEKTLVTGKDNAASLPPELLDTIHHKMGKVRTPFTITAGKKRYFAEPLVDPGCLYLVGAGHVSLATAQLAGFVDFAVKVMDDRAEFANRNRFPDADEVIVVKDFTACLPELGEDDYVVIVTRGHAHDQEVVQQALTSGAGYIGMIGSRKKRDVCFKKLAASGFSAAQIERVHCPVGLAIGANTPKEIAISIVAELVAHRAKHNF